MTLHFEDVDGNNWLTDVNVAEEQKRFVASKDHLLARAYAFRDRRSRAFFVMVGTVPVDMGLYYDADPIQTYFLSQLFIDECYQGRGYGEAALNMILELLRRDGKYPAVRLICLEDNAPAMRLYASCGFYELKRDGAEVFMECRLHEK